MPFLGAGFVNDLGTVIALGLIFAPFSFRTVIFVVICLVTFFFLPVMTRHMMKRYAFKTAAIRTKWILFILFLLGSLALWAGSEAVLPAYIIGMVLSTTVNKDDHFIRRLRTLTIGFLTPGTISALYGLTNGIITKDQYSYLVAVVIGSAVIPTIIANFAFLPRHLLKIPSTDEEILQLDHDLTDAQQHKINSQ